MVISNIQKVKVIELFELIKEKVFSGIPINYDFEVQTRMDEINLKRIIDLNDNNNLDKLKINSKENNGNE